MARYFFDVHDGMALRRDRVGSELDGREAVRREAMEVLPLVAKSSIAKAEEDRQAFTILVRDEGNRTVYTATLTFAGLWMGDVPIPDPDPFG